LRNPTIANLFFLAGEIEKFGTGIKKIINACQDYNIPNPEFDNSSNAFCVIFRKFLSRKKIDEFTLNSRQKKLIEFIIKNNFITRKKYIKLFPDISIETIRLDINDMIDKKNLIKIGETKGVKYKLSPNYQIITKSKKL